MTESYLLALAVGALWASSPIIVIDLVRRNGALVSNAMRMVYAGGLFVLLGYLYTDWSTIDDPAIIAALISGLVGVMIGDGMLFLGLSILGPRRNSMLFSTNIIFSLGLGFLLLNEVYSPLSWVGALLLMAGVFVAITYAPSRSGRTQVGTIIGNDDISGKFVLGIMAGLTAAFCQAFGMFILADHLKAGADPVGLSAIRLGFPALIILPYILWKMWRCEFSYKDSVPIGIMGILAMGVGGYIVQYALKTAELGIINLLTSTSPIWVLPMLWLKTGSRPHWIAWVGAFVGCVGISCIFIPEFAQSLWG